MIKSGFAFARVFHKRYSRYNRKLRSMRWASQLTSSGESTAGCRQSRLNRVSTGDTSDVRMTGRYRSPRHYIFESVLVVL